MNSIWKNGMYGIIVGDALVVPVEFISIAERKADPVIVIRAYMLFMLHHHFDGYICRSHIWTDI